MKLAVSAKRKINHWNILHALFRSVVVCVILCAANSCYCRYHFNYILRLRNRSRPSKVPTTYTRTFPLMMFILNVFFLLDVKKVTRWSNNNINHGLSAFPIKNGLLFMDTFSVYKFRYLIFSTGKVSDILKIHTFMISNETIFMAMVTIATEQVLVAQSTDNWWSLSHSVVVCLLSSRRLQWLLWWWWWWNCDNKLASR